MTTSTQQMLNGMKALDPNHVDKKPTDVTSPFTRPPSIPKPREERDMGKVLANFLGSGQKPGNAPR